MNDDPNGRGVDARGNPAIDPTKNVLDTVEAAVDRLDDLREQAVRRLDDLRQTTDDHAREIRNLERHYEAALRKAETDRIDAIRLVDTGTVARTAETNAAAASALAAQLVATAEQNRTQVASAAAAAVTSLAAALEPIQKDIRDLRDQQARGQGGKEQNVESGVAGRATIALAIAATGVFASIVLGAAAITITLIVR